MPKFVLIAESNPMFSEVLAGTFSSLGFSVMETVATRPEALARVQDNPPDVLVFDMNLLTGGMNGLADLKHLKERFPEVKILIMGAHESLNGLLQYIFNAGLDGYWNKFDKRDALLSALKFHSH